MTNYEKEDHKIVVSKISWDGLASIIIDMEKEIIELSQHMSKKEIKKLQQVLLIYELEKNKRLKNSHTHWNPVNFEYGENFSTTWNDE